MDRITRASIVVLISATLLSVIGATRAVADVLNISESSYATPEAAISAFLSALAENDLDKAVGACAIDEVGSRFDFAGMSKYLNAVVWFAQLSPSNYPLLGELNRIEETARIFKQIKFFTFSLVSTESDFDHPLTLPSDERIADFIQSVDPVRLAKMKVREIGAFELQKSPRYIENAKRFAALYGADDASERVVLIEFEQRMYEAGFHLLKYGNSWKIDSLSSPIGNTSAMGAVQETTQEDFDDELAN